MPVSLSSLAVGDPFVIPSIYPLGGQVAIVLDPTLVINAGSTIPESGNVLYTVVQGTTGVGSLWRIPGTDQVEPAKKTENVVYSA